MDYLLFIFKRTSNKLTLMKNLIATLAMITLFGISLPTRRLLKKREEMLQLKLLSIRSQTTPWTIPGSWMRPKRNRHPMQERIPEYTSS